MLNIAIQSEGAVRFGSLPKHTQAHVEKAWGKLGKNDLVVKVLIWPDGGDYTWHSSTVSCKENQIDATGTPIPSYFPLLEFVGVKLGNYLVTLPLEEKTLWFQCQQESWDGKKPERAYDDAWKFKASMI